MNIKNTNKSLLIGNYKKFIISKKVKFRKSNGSDERTLTNPKNRKTIYDLQIISKSPDNELEPSYSSTEEQKVNHIYINGGNNFTGCYNDIEIILWISTINIPPNVKQFLMNLKDGNFDFVYINNQISKDPQ